MQLRLILLVFLVVPQFVALMKMAKIFGKVENPPSPKYSSLTSMKLCFDECYYDTDCFLVEFHSEECVFYHFSIVQTSIKVVETQPQSEMYVAFKTILPKDTCPASFEDINLTYIHPDGTAYSWKVDSDRLSFPKCRYDWKLFERDNGNTICMKVVYEAKMGVKREDAKLGCEALEASLIGVETLQEANWMWDELPTSPNGITFWVDGVRNNSCRPRTSSAEDKASGCNVFDWSNNLTSGSALFSGDEAYLKLSYFNGENREDCLAVATERNGNKIFNDVYCVGYTQASGMICGYKLD